MSASFRRISAGYYINDDDAERAIIINILTTINIPVSV